MGDLECLRGELFAEANAEALVLVVMTSMRTIEQKSRPEAVTDRMPPGRHPGDRHRGVCVSAARSSLTHRHPALVGGIAGSLVGALAPAPPRTRDGGDEASPSFHAFARSAVEGEEREA